MVQEPQSAPGNWQIDPEGLEGRGTERPMPAREGIVPQ